MEGTWPGADVTFQNAVMLFNQQEFFACHDVLEELWASATGVDRDFLQGLIHAAVALFHFSEGNLTGARKIHDSAIRYLSSCGDSMWGVDLNRFRRDFDRCFRSLLGSHVTYPANVVLDHTFIPQIDVIG
jgi:Uncharacterized conserved protein